MSLIYYKEEFFEEAQKVADELKEIAQDRFNKNPKHNSHYTCWETDCEDEEAMVFIQTSDTTENVYLLSLPGAEITQISYWEWVDIIMTHLKIKAYEKHKPTATAEGGAGL